VDEQLVDASAKMVVLERLLEALFERGHKVLVFSQFVTMLNVIEVGVPTLSSRHLFMDDGDDSPTKTKPKQRARQSGRRASGRGKRTRVESDDDCGSEDVGGEL